jgi:septum formation protein
MKTGLILASASERRQQLLSKAGIVFQVVESRVEEHFSTEAPVEQEVVRLALQKAAFVEELHPDSWILAADTIVAFGGEILQKPGSSGKARQMLQRLSGRSHEVFTGFCLRHRRKSRTRTGVSRTVVTMKPLAPREIAGYVATGEPMDKAGAYGIQGVAAMFIESICGSYTNVVGLPLAEVVSLLEEEGVVSLWEDN